MKPVCGLTGWPSVADGTLRCGGSDSQVVELELKDGKTACDRNKPLDYRWSPDRLDW